jgi:hypothetical protein
MNQRFTDYFANTLLKLDYEIIKHDRDTRFTSGFGLKFRQVRNVFGSFSLRKIVFLSHKR